MPSWLSDLLSNATFAAIAGFIVGSALSYVAGAGVSRRQRRDTHRAATRAVVYELAENLGKLAEARSPGRHLTTKSFDALVIPLYTDLPDDVAQHVSLAYAMLHVAGTSLLPLAPATRTSAHDQASKALDVLRAYATRKLHVKLDWPEPG